MKRFMICLVCLAFGLALAAGAEAQIAQRETLFVDDGDGEPLYTETGTGWDNSSYGYSGGSRVIVGANVNTGQTARWTPDIATAGYYFVSFYLPPTSNSHSKALYIVSPFGTSPDSSYHDQNYNSGQWIALGTHYFIEGTVSYVEAVNDSNEYVGYAFRADATRCILGPDDQDIEPDRRNAYDYGEVGLGQPKDWVLRLYNIGGEDLTIDEVTFGTTNFSVYSPALPVNIEARGYKDLTIRCLLFQEDSYSDLMTIHSNDPDEPTLDFSIAAEGVGQYVLVNNDDGSPGYVEEAGTWTNSDGRAQCTGITNTSSRYTYSDGAIATFTPDVTMEGLYRIYYAGPLTSNANDHALVVVRPFGTAEDSVYIDQNTGAACDWKYIGTYYFITGTLNSASLVDDGTGSGVLRADLMKFTNVPNFPVIYLTENDHEFADVPIDETEEWSFLIQNIGNADLTISNIINTNPSVFTLTSPTSFPAVVPGLDSIKATVSFNPADIDSFETTLRIASDALNYDTLSVSLTGNGIGNYVQVDDLDGEPTFSRGHYEGPVPIVEDTSWAVSTSTYGVNSTSLFTSLLSHPGAFCKWVPDVPATAEYDLYISTVPSENSCDRAPYFVHYSLGLLDTVQADQNSTTADNVWIHLGRYEFQEGTLGYVELINDTTIIQPTEADTVVLRADAVKLTEAPTGVAVATFFAEIEDEGVAVHWSTTDPYHLDRFNIYRLTRRNARPGPQDRINDQSLHGTSPYVYLDTDVLPGEIYYYWLEQIDETGQSIFHGPAIANLSGLVPDTYALFQNYPNPFNPETTIRYALPREEQVTLQIFNIRGQMVKTLADEPAGAGYHSLVWDGRNEAGQAVASGIYFVQLQAGAYHQTRKLALIK